METDMLVALIQKEQGLTNVKVIKRHLRAMESLGLLTREDVGYVLSSEGKALCALVSPNSKNGLHVAEKVFFLRALGSYLPLQLSSILAAISENIGAPKDRAITSYGQRILSGSTWKNRKELESRFARQDDSPPRKVRNNFDCFQLWLKQLELVRAEGLRLTELGEKVADIAMTNTHELKQKAYWLGSAYVCREPGCLPEFDYQARPYPKSFIELLRKAYLLFERPELRLADVRSISVYICIQLLVENHKILSENDFWHLVRSLLREGIFRSAITDRSGKLAYISLGLAAR